MHPKLCQKTPLNLWDTNPRYISSGFRWVVKHTWWNVIYDSIPKHIFNKLLSERLSNDTSNCLVLGVSENHVPSSDSHHLNQSGLHGNHVAVLFETLHTKKLFLGLSPVFVKASQAISWALSQPLHFSAQFCYKKTPKVPTAWVTDHRQAFVHLDEAEDLFDVVISFLKQTNRSQGANP